MICPLGQIALKSHLIFMCYETRYDNCHAFLGPYNSGPPHFWTIKLDADIDTCQTISLA